MSATSLPLLGPAQVWYGAAGAETELGKTRGINWRFQDVTAEVRYDQTGTTPWDEYIVGKPTEVEANFANLSYYLIERLMPNQATTYGGVVTPTPAPGDDALDVLTGIGISMRDNSQRLILIPYRNNVPSALIEDWVFFPLAYPRINADLVFDAETQRVINVTFRIFPVSQAIPRLFFMGDESLIPAA